MNDLPFDKGRLANQQIQKNVGTLGICRGYIATYHAILFCWASVLEEGGIDSWNQCVLSLMNLLPTRSSYQNYLIIFLPVNIFSNFSNL